MNSLNKLGGARAASLQRYLDVFLEFVFKGPPVFPFDADLTVVTDDVIRFHGFR